MNLTLRVNGRSVDVDVEPSTMLVDVLRDQVGLTGPRVTCGVGLCGTCTVLLDGEPVSGCILMTPLAVGKEITTVEGLPEDDRVVACFDKHHAFQCGWCTPGMILGAVGLLRRTPHPSEAEIVAGMNGHICRCGTYNRIVSAVQLAATRMAGESRA